VVRPGGVVYLDFGPLYHSPWGLHEYQAINLPYCQVLFEKDVLASFVHDHELGWVDFDAVNQWGLPAYRRLWTEVGERVKVAHYYERRNLRYLDLIGRYPSCFRSASSCFDDFVVSNIEVLFIKRSR